MSDSTPYSFVLPANTAAGIAAAPATDGLGRNLSYQSYVAMNDGSVGAVLAYSDPSTISSPRLYWATSPTPAGLFVASSVTLGSVLWDHSGLKHANFRASVNRGPDGNLYIVAWTIRQVNMVAGLMSVPPDEGTYVYTSADEGASWSYVGAVQEYTNSVSGGAFGGYGDTGEIHYTDSGRWVVGFSRIRNYFGASRGGAGIRYSDDLGVTWSSGQDMSNNYTQGSSRQIVYNSTDGYLYFFLQRSQNPNYQWWYSTDDGATWTQYWNANFFSGDPMLNKTVTGVTSPSGMNLFASTRGNSAFAYASSVSLPDSSDLTPLETWNSFLAEDQGFGIQPVGGGLWAMMDPTEILVPAVESGMDMPIVTSYVDCGHPDCSPA